MNFALLGADPDSLALARAVTEDPSHALVWASVPRNAAAEVRRLAPAAEVTDAWESLLGGAVADAVIVGRGGPEEERAEQLRKLVQAAVPLLVSHPVHPSMLVVYELEMIRQETGCRLLPYHQARYTAAFDRLLALAAGADARLGSLQQVVFERRLADRTPQRVREEFARDMDLARALAGELNKLSAMAPSSEPSGYANLGVQLSGEAGILVRWSVEPADRDAEARLTVVGSHGTATLTMPQRESVWQLELTTENRSTTESLDTDGAPRAAIARMAELVARGSNARPAPARPTWPDAARAIELADSIQRSLDRGRTVELYHEDFTEQGTFKGTMTSLGCGLLWGALVVLVIGVAAAGMHLPLADYWPQFLLVVLVLFLLLQLLRFAFPAGPPQSSPRGAKPGK